MNDNANGTCAFNVSRRLMANALHALRIHNASLDDAISCPQVCNDPTCVIHMRRKVFGAGFIYTNSFGLTCCVICGVPFEASNPDREVDVHLHTRHGMTRGVALQYIDNMFEERALADSRLASIAQQALSIMPQVSGPGFANDGLHGAIQHQPGGFQGQSPYLVRGPQQALNMIPQVAGPEFVNNGQYGAVQQQYSGFQGQSPSPGGGPQQVSGPGSANYGQYGVMPSIEQQPTGFQGQSSPQVHGLQQALPGSGLADDGQHGAVQQQPDTFQGQNSSPVAGPSQIQDQDQDQGQDQVVHTAIPNVENDADVSEEDRIRDKMHEDFIAECQRTCDEIDRMNSGEDRLLKRRRS